MPFGSPEALTSSPGHVCLSCRERPPHFDQALAAGLFEGSLREAIHVFKYQAVWALGRPLSEWMASQVNVSAPLDMVMPVPLHTKRLRERGFNQALLLANGVAVRFAIPLVLDNLVRVRFTRPQVELAGRDRMKNVSGAFSLRCPDVVHGKRVLLIDDVFTTGATLNECSRVLKHAQAHSVTAFTLARTGES
jgi:ComF family protein